MSAQKVHFLSARIKYPSVEFHALNQFKRLNLFVLALKQSLYMKKFSILFIEYIFIN
ncbi:hypothetical protein AM1_5215 [Acaryochloris marina MBIC11017]|uniref:Uncharacterized protein n=1 Tax=Acaryochloris marina (strain MBIC 11017) TaxID=329726 RepID=B0C9M9_ACAM1|nr:hypothetical protein AM1_5215 [Acaryochloris marina MBIC11017]